MDGRVRYQESRHSLCERTAVGRRRCGDPGHSAQKAIPGEASDRSEHTAGQLQEGFLPPQSAHSRPDMSARRLRSLLPYIRIRRTERMAMMATGHTSAEMHAIYTNIDERIAREIALRLDRLHQERQGREMEAEAENNFIH